MRALHDRVHAQFERDTSNLIAALQRGIDLDVESLESIGSLFAASAQVDREGFGAFVKDALLRHPAIQALEWIPRVPYSERARYEQAAREDGLADFQFTERTVQGEMSGVSERDEYFPVYYVEPLEGNEAALGFDLASNPTRLAALEAARDTGESVASSRITLVQELGTQYGFLVFKPIYRKRAPGETLEPRPEVLSGSGPLFPSRASDEAVERRRENLLGYAL